MTENNSVVQKIANLITTLRSFDFLQKSDVVDNLSSTNSDVPLSANQGKVLNDLIGSHNTNEQAHQDIRTSLNGKVSSSSLSTVATSGDYDDLLNKPDIPSQTSDLVNDSGFITSSSVPSASSTTPSADTLNGSVGTGTAWARSDHTHPKSSLYAESTHTHDYMKNTDFFDMLDCINVNFNNLDNIYLLDTVFNISNYNGLPSKNSSVVNDILRNNAISQIGLNKEFTPSTKYTLKFDYYTSVSNRNGFSFGADPSLEDGTSMNYSDTGLQVLVDDGNNYVETFNGTPSPTNVYTHTSNLFTSGTHHIRIVRNNTNVVFYIDDVELYTYTNAKYNTIGLNKWGGGYNTISNIEIKIGD